MAYARRYIQAMNDLKQYVSIISTSVVCVVFVYIFYGLYQILEVGNRKNRIDEKAQFWMQNEPEACSYIVREGCMFGRAYQVIHSNNEDLYFDIRTFCDLNDQPKCDVKKNNILGIFERIKEISESAEMLDVIYSPLGFPQKVDIDWRSDAIDDECFIVVEGFQEI